MKNNFIFNMVIQLGTFEYTDKNLQPLSVIKNYLIDLYPTNLDYWKSQLGKEILN